MKRILIFGTGKSALDIGKCLVKEKTNIIAYIDNNPIRRNMLFNGKIVISAKKINEYDFDYIIIGVNKYSAVTYNEILVQLSKENIDKNKIIEFFGYDIDRYDEIKEYINVELMNYINIMARLDSEQMYLNNLKYEIIDGIQREKIQIPKIENMENTIKDIIQKKLSISRFGDGELALIFGDERCRFQNADEKLILRLKEILKSKNEKILIGLINFFGNLNEFSESHQKMVRRTMWTFGREKIYELLDMEKKYYDAQIFRPYFHFKNKKQAKNVFKLVKKIWDNRDVTIIEGKNTRLGIGNDLLNNSNSIERIITLDKNAFSNYNNILNEALKINKNRLILISLGPTATVLAYDLAVLGYQAIDIGHIDIEYEHFLLNAEQMLNLKNKFNNDAYDQREYIELDKENRLKYMNEIVAEVL